MTLLPGIERDGTTHITRTVYTHAKLSVAGRGGREGERARALWLKCVCVCKAV